MRQESPTSYTSLFCRLSTSAVLAERLGNSLPSCTTRVRLPRTALLGTISGRIVCLKVSSGGGELMMAPEETSTCL